MMSILLDMVEDTSKLLMDDFSVLGDFFYSCLRNRVEVLKCCEEYNHVLNLESFTSW